MESETIEGTDGEAPSVPEPGLIGRISRLESAAAAVAVVVLVVLAIAEPDILGAPFENTRTIVFTFGGTVAAAIALVVMLKFRVPAPVRLLVVGAPFVAVSWLLLSPFFIDDKVDDDFATSIAAATEPPADPDAGTAPAPGASTPDPAASTPTRSAEPAAPRLLGAGQFVGLAGHDGRGDAGFFALDSEAVVLRLESFDIQNGPDLRLYVVPGPGATSPGDSFLDLGALRGNVGDQTYELPADFTLHAGEWTVLVWCDAFSVEFVAATVTVT